MTSMRTQVEQTIEVIRPALHADGGDIELVDVDESTGVVSVKLVGACGTCPTSTVTLKAVDAVAHDALDAGITEVVNLSPSDELDGPPRVSPFSSGSAGAPA